MCMYSCIHEKHYIKIESKICMLFPETFEADKVVIRSSTSKDRQYNGHKKTNKRTNNDLQNITQKTKDLAWMNSDAPEG